jgi:MFS family permease
LYIDFFMKTQPNEQVPAHILPIIVLAQFCGTSLWFAGNAILPELSATFNLGATAVANLTSAVQLGFIAGTLTFAFLNIADRFSPRKVFLLSAMLGATFNALIMVAPFGVVSLWIYRFATGFFLAGIYPVGMKIASDWYQGKLGKALGYLVGALVLGTAFPHLVRSYNTLWSWHTILWSISVISAMGGILLFFLVPDGPHRLPGSPLRITALAEIFRVHNFRAAAYGYFGHMWEIYTFWAFVPLMLVYYSENSETGLSVSFWSFVMIACGALGCVGGGYLALRKGSARTAFILLTISALCCLSSPLAFPLSPALFLLFLMIWGVTVAGDSPQFSTLVAQTAPRQYTGTALTITNCIGFAITVPSIQLTGYLSAVYGIQFSLVFLTIGPCLGLMSIGKMIRRSGQT